MSILNGKPALTTTNEAGIKAEKRKINITHSAANSLVQALTTAVQVEANVELSYNSHVEHVLPVAAPKER